VTVVGTIAIVAIVIAAGMWISRRRGLFVKPAELAEPRPRASHAAGEAPATAIRAGGEQLARLRISQRCRACRSVMAPGSEEHVRYGDGELLVIELRCGACDARRALYINEIRPMD
jgi:hypothetical protein